MILQHGGRATFWAELVANHRVEWADPLQMRSAWDGGILDVCSEYT